MDRITKQLVKDFLESQELSESAPDKDFELFSNFSVISKEYNRTFDVRTLTIGSGNDTGIDGIAIIINGFIVDDIDEVNDLIEHNGYLEVTYVFIQSKTSPSFDFAQINSFLFGIKDFFSETPGLIRNEDVTRFAEISNHILQNAARFKQNPKCKLYYVTTGKWSNDQNHTAAVNAAINDLDAENIFESIEFNPIGASELTKLYRQTKNPSTAEFIFTEKVTLPEINGVQESYYGILPFEEFKKILVDESGSIRSIFDDNVRDFQGSDNPVNKKIKSTLTSEDPKQFVVLNNGVTVVATTLKTSGNKFIISDFQIVNGCQTSNILYQNIDNIELLDLHIPFRLIVTTEDDVKSKITLATNSQTAIKTEQLAALSEFQRNLELYYSATDGDGKLFYERRTKQYNSKDEVIKNRIITVANQIKSFSAMFYQNPHLVTSFFGSIAKKVNSSGSGIFKEDHSFAPYYLSGLAFYKLDQLFRSGAIDTKYRKVKFHLIMLFRLIAEEGSPPGLNNRKKAEAYCDIIVKKLLDQSQCVIIFNKAVSIVNESGIDLSDKTQFKQSSMVDNILLTFESSHKGN